MSRKRLKQGRPREGEAPDELLDARIGLQLTRRDRDAYRQCADARGIPLNRWIREALREQLGRELDENFWNLNCRSDSDDLRTFGISDSSTED